VKRSTVEQTPTLQPMDAGAGGDALKLMPCLSRVPAMPLAGPTLQ